MKSAIVLSLVFAACAVEDPDESSIESEGSTFQGSTFQGSTFQGSTFQGSTFQGSTFQGSTFQGGNYGSYALAYQSVTGTELTAWRQRTDGIWEERSPKEICYWNSSRTQMSSCTPISLSTSPSPLTGMTWPGTFIRPDGTTFQSSIRIGTSTSMIGALTNDTGTYAMHPLYGSDANGGVYFSSVGCSNPNGCRKNSDLWLYDVRIVGVYDSKGQMATLCPAGEKAFALKGYWDSNGRYVSSSTQFTFACTNGTIAKCTRWGYRRWTGADKSDGSHASMSDYHQACVRAGTADYCANGHSFTKNGTLVDVYDYEPQQVGFPGFIPRTAGVEYTLGHQSTTAFVWESRFDRYGAVELDFLRYQELALDPDYGSTETYCPGRFAAPTAPEPGQLHRPYTRVSPAASGPSVSIDNTVVCSHSEQTPGKWLHPTCSACTNYLWGIAGSEWSCITPGGAWTSDCAAVAGALCSTSPTSATGMMATHSECATGAKLSLYDSACTIRVCGANASCCSSSWSSSCVTTANQVCTGGSEAAGVGFCGTGL